MLRALQLARTAADLGEVPVGAVVYRTATGEVLGEAFNTRERDADPSAHAEFTAILQACRAVGDWRLNDCTCVVTLEPCPMCAGLLVNARLGRLVYAADDPRAGAVRSLFTIADDPRLNHRVRIISGVEAPHAARLLRDFFRALRDRRGNQP
jgi:tRNA(adenine34) deaminase